MFNKLFNKEEIKKFREEHATERPELAALLNDNGSVFDWSSFGKRPAWDSEEAKAFREAHKDERP